MKFFALYTKVNIINKPTWLDDYKQKFGEPYDYHITLKQPCFIEDDDVETLKDKVVEYFQSIPIGSIEVTFSKVKLDEPRKTDGGYVMLVTPGDDKLIELQKGLVNCLSEYTNYVEKTKDYEDNFVPHITIGYDLPPTEFSDAVSEIPDSIEITAIIDGVILAIVKDKSEAERTNPKNLTEFQLKSGI